MLVLDSELGCDVSMGPVIGSELGCVVEMSPMMGPETSCDALDLAGNMFISISKFLILFHPPPVCKRGAGSKFQGRQRVYKVAFDNNFRAWLGVLTLETFNIHPLIVKYGTRKQLAK